ncbi:SDR family NAD(P)-dependent oxidoreductase [Rhizobium tubonense]|uniref:Short-chain dehydrogenase n=1 Tax=Rhizobium tubonense TaxID=484088 RepID=A0A2W4CPX0_9HYPH|nr:SDR family oxidoreductase [Rhizobium tubonense]PZM12988.1 short-chain dehydrogenase [Rhizobium tubonense]
MDMGLRDKCAVITGGSVGIGLAVADAIAAEGGNLILVARDETRLETVSRELRAKHRIKVLPLARDVTKPEGIDEIVDAAAKFGGVDILINNAGTGSNETVMEAPDEKWQFYWDLHVMAAVRLSRGLVPQMKARGGGVILNNASICAVQPLWYEPIYNVTKSALMAFSKSLSTELIPSNIRVNCVNPGLVLTPDWIKTAKQLTEQTPNGWQDYLDGVADEHAPIKRFANAEEIANLFVFLCSDRASYCVGGTYFIDGGMLKTI